ncbi:MAG: DJ-1/PfpI family protein [Candidatus Pacebacteria bacterium]|jgi:protease I|nr:DJ-1/PfpI family protein [Candidatus Paceibacterota bacterium]
MKSLNNKKVAVVIAFRGFRDIEYFVPVDILKKVGAGIKVISSKTGKAIGDEGGEVEVDMNIAQVDLTKFDAVVFVGGPGMSDNLDNPDFQQLARKAEESGLLLGAICIAPALLAKAGILKGKKATVWSSPLDKTAIKILKENGAEFQDSDVVVDGKVITASGPHAAEEFGWKLAGLLTGK